MQARNRCAAVKAPLEYRWFTDGSMRHAPGLSRTQHIKLCRQAVLALTTLELPVGETVLLLHPPLPLVGGSKWTERGCQQNGCGRGGGGPVIGTAAPAARPRAAGSTWRFAESSSPSSPSPRGACSDRAEVSAQRRRQRPSGRRQGAVKNRWPDLSCERRELRSGHRLAAAVGSQGDGVYTGCAARSYY